jgi:hypothetical protein
MTPAARIAALDQAEALCWAKLQGIRAERATLQEGLGIVPDPDPFEFGLVMIESMAEDLAELSALRADVVTLSCHLARADEEIAELRQSIDRRADAGDQEHRAIVLRLSVALAIVQHRAERLETLATAQAEHLRSLRFDLEEEHARLGGALAELAGERRRANLAEESLDTACSDLATLRLLCQEERRSKEAMRVELGRATEESERRRCHLMMAEMECHDAAVLIPRARRRAAAWHKSAKGWYSVAHALARQIDDGNTDLITDAGPGWIGDLPKEIPCVTS